MITDDARIVDAKACQVESWVTSYRGSTEYSTQPACNFTGNLELTLGGTRTNAHGHGQTTDQVLQGKTVLRPLQTNGWGLGLAAGIVGHPQAAAGRDWYAYVPVSFSLRDDAALVHANIGWLREGSARRERLTWGLGTEVQLTADTWLIAETFGRTRAGPGTSWACAIGWLPIACSWMPPTAIAMARARESAGFRLACAC